MHRTRHLVRRGKLGLGKLSRNFGGDIFPGAVLPAKAAEADAA